MATKLDRLAQAKLRVKLRAKEEATAEAPQNKKASSRALAAGTGNDTRAEGTKRAKGTKENAGARANHSGNQASSASRRNTLLRAATGSAALSKDELQALRKHIGSSLHVASKMSIKSCKFYHYIQK